ncbi:MAG: hypothetical protein R3C30_11235 [Hyphomonadaceae bacterium]
MIVRRSLAAVFAAVLLASCDRIQSLLPQPEFDGAYAVIEADQSAIVSDHLEQMSEQGAQVLRAAGVSYVGRGVSDGVLRFRLERAAQTQRALEALAPISGHLVVSALPDGVIEARVDDAYVDSLAASATEQAVEIVRRRVARMRPPVLVEPHGPSQIIVRTTQPEMPPMLLMAVTQRGQIAFHIVREVSPEALGRLPAGTMLAPPFLPGAQQEVVERRPRLVGHIASANPSTDVQTGQFVLSFQFDAEGARAFCSITTAHTGERFAILLDGRVVTAPTINERICGGSGQISGNFTAESANELAIVLRAGALPLPFNLLAEGVGAPPTPPTP